MNFLFNSGQSVQRSTSRITFEDTGYGQDTIFFTHAHMAQKD